jgi:hypothetical protein
MPHAGAGQGRFTSRVSCSHNDDIIIFLVSIQKNNLNPWERDTFHVKHISMAFFETFTKRLF